MQTITGNNNPNLLTGTDDTDFIFGFGGNDDLEGLAGNDVLEGGDGSDFLTGGSGNDLLAGGSGDDGLLGQSGDDILVGGRGADNLIGGQGRDLMTGGAGADTFFPGDFEGTLINNNFDTDRIIDFNSSEDTLKVIKGYQGVNSTADIALVSSDAEAAKMAQTLVYSKGSGTLFYNLNGSADGFGVTNEKLAVLVGAPTLSLNNFSVLSVYSSINSRNIECSF